MRDLFVDATGQYVAQGQPLFTLYSPELHRDAAGVPARPAHARPASGRRRAPTRASTPSASRDAARQRLALWDLPADGDRRARAHARAARDSVTFRSPASGHVIEKKVVRGQRVMAGESLYRLADLSTRVGRGRRLPARPRGREGGAARRRSPWTSGPTSAFPGARGADRAVAGRRSRARRACASRCATPAGGCGPGMFANVELATSGARGPRGADRRRRGLRRARSSCSSRRATATSSRARCRPARASTASSRSRAGSRTASRWRAARRSSSTARASCARRWRGYRAAPDLASGAAADAPARPGGSPIDFRTDPDPPSHGDNMLVVVVVTRHGRRARHRRRGDACGSTWRRCRR